MTLSEFYMNTRKNEEADHSDNVASFFASDRWDDMSLTHIFV